MSAIRHTLGRLGLFDLADAVFRSIPTSTRVLLHDRPVVRRYFQAHAERRLHIGSGPNLLHGWLNTHYSPGLKGLARARRRGHYFVHLDCSRPFPFEPKAFSYVFSEHMIEHIPYETARAMLSECYRVLTPGGKIRISTPNLGMYVGLFRGDLTDEEVEFVRTYSRKYFANVAFPHPAFVLNNIVRNWEHRFIYDEDVLRNALESAGFTSVTRCEFRVSESPALSELETFEREYNRLESLIMEGTA